jgi:hypothetical protein
MPWEVYCRDRAGVVHGCSVLDVLLAQGVHEWAVWEGLLRKPEGLRVCIKKKAKLKMAVLRHDGIVHDISCHYNINVAQCLR